MYHFAGYTEESEHSSININGTIYVPIADFVEGTGIGKLHYYGNYSANVLIIENE